MCILAALWVYFFVPELKNRTLDEIDELFGDNSGRSKWEGDLMLQAQQEVGLLRILDDDRNGVAYSSAKTANDEKKTEFHN